MAIAPHLPAPEAYVALRITVEEYRDRMYSMMRLNDPLWISGMRAKFIEMEKQYRRAGDALQSDLYHALSHAALRLHQTAQYNKTIADECACYDEVFLTRCQCPYQSVDFHEENRLLQDVVTGTLVKEWERRGIPHEEATVAVALNNPFALSAPNIR